MKKYLFSLFALALILFVGCIDDPEGNRVEDEGEAVSPLGVWQVTLPPIPGKIPDTTTVQMSFAESGTDTAYSIVVEQFMLTDYQTIYSSIGTASMNDTVMTVTGEECEILDTTTIPSQLVPLVEGCNEPMDIDLQGIKEQSWSIQGSTIARLPIIADDVKELLSAMTIRLMRIE